MYQGDLGTVTGLRSVSARCYGDDQVDTVGLVAAEVGAAVSEVVVETTWS